MAKSAGPDIPMLKHQLVEIAAANVQSLAWDGNDLIDWVGGGARYELDGKHAAARVRYAYTFDAAATSPSGEFQVIYTRLGTKGLVLRRGEIIREINRSFYQADVYEYPLALFCLEDGREVLAHCPDEYCRLELHDLASGERLTDSDQRSPGDFFHSRLAISPCGRYLLSAGWIWHPVDAVHVYDIATALANPSHLDGAGLPLDARADESSATFLDNGRLAVALDGCEIDEDEIPPPSARELRIYDLATAAVLASTRPPEKVGSMMAVGAHHLLTLHEHPRLLHIPSNEIIRSWPEIRSGTQISGILMDRRHLPPPMALDPVNARCAIASSNCIHVLLFEGVNEG
ncbi:hypothetical protein [Steroidobacter cummioxidans]|uniref:hypothetical protein n=1 Tax=Steroidobacter cummioxidans TaxID=1803913 RepID=UPI000E3169EC|nr:hypothetical protein [Steroidobacter cummioxidans]